MIVKLLTNHNLEFLSLKGGCTGLSASTLVKMPHCLKSHVAAQLWKDVKVKLIAEKAKQKFYLKMLLIGE